MFTLIIGGSASGKSSYAERLTVSLPGDGPRIYLATMEAFGAEAHARIARHRQMRRGRGFETLECTRNLASAQVPPGSNVLLEDMGNLVANELFGDPDPLLRERNQEAADKAGAEGQTHKRPGGRAGNISYGQPGGRQEGDRDHAAARILAGLEHLRSRSAHLTIVTNDVFSAGNDYEGDTDRYLRVLADVNRALAAGADRVVELVCGQPVVLCDRGEVCFEAAILCGSGSYRQNCLRGSDEGISAQKRFGMSGSTETVTGKEAGMIFVTGPLYAGKQAYIMQALGWTEADFAVYGVRDVQDLAAEAVREGEPLTELADRLAEKEVVIATEVGGGVVPMDPVQRREREAAGRLSCLLAERARRVIRVCCGLPQVLK